RERLFGLAAERELALQRLLDRRPVDCRPFGAELREQSLLLRHLRGQRFAPVVELRKPIAAAALGERRLLGSSLGGAYVLSRLRLLGFRFVARAPRGIALDRLVVERGLSVGEFAARRLRALALGILLRGNARELLADLRTALLRGLRRLLKLQQFK